MKNLKFLIKTAFRDSRKDRGKLLLFMSSIILGIAALVAINSFNDNLVEDINTQAKSLLGADLVITSNKKPTEEISNILDSIPGEKASQIELFSMAYLPQQETAQFSRIKALEGGFPFYGKLKTIPEEAYEDFQNNHIALVDDGMMLQYNVEVGDSIRIGERTFEIGGRLMSTFGNVGLGSSFAPAIYIPKSDLISTNLVQPGSFLEYAFYYKTPATFNDNEWKDVRRRTLRDDAFRIETIEDQQENLEQAFSSLNNFLNLIALVSLLLACIGVASSVLIYIKNKVSSIAIFRCLGMQGKEAFFIYLFQIISIGMVSVVLGAILGSGIQVLLPLVLKDLLPYEVNMDISWPAIGEGISVGIIITTLFALIPLISIRKVSPLQTLRNTGTDQIGKGKSKWIIYGLITLGIFIYLWRLLGTLQDAGVFAIGLLVAFAVLWSVASLITWLIRKYFPRNWSFVFRQGLSNLYRPNNQTKTLIISIGLGTAILTTLFVIQGLILRNVASMGAGNQPNMILYGIERNQTDSMASLTESFKMPVVQQVPVVTMDLVSWKGRTKKEWLQDTTRTARRWAINREARVSFQEEVSPDEKLVEGTYTGRVSPGDSIFISLGKRYANGLDVALGDEMIWNVQGALITTYIGSIRELDFRKMESRFFILFPMGVLEEAPQFNILVTKSPDKRTTAAYRNAVVKNFPNVSVIDLGSILETLNDILTKVTYVIKFMAAFSILIGLIVLISSLFLSKFQRIKESVLLRTIGALRKQIVQINFVEYSLIGVLSSATGIVLSLVASYFLCKYVFELEFKIEWLPILLVFIFITTLTVIIGLYNSRDVINRPPLEVLRREA